MKPIIVDFTHSDSKFLYIQLYETLKRDILDGSAKPGEKLPSLRKLAKDLNMSVTTIELAYNQLLVEGYIVSRPQSGYYVAEIRSTQGATVEDEDYEVEEFGDFAYDESPYYYDTNSFEFIRWKKCISKVYNDYSSQLLFESDPQGELALRYEISKYLYRQRGVSASPDRIVVGAGTQHLTWHLAKILSMMGISLVSLETPGYLPVQSVFKDINFSIYHIPVNENGIDIEKLPANISSAVYVSPSNQFPTGAVMPVGRRYELLTWAKDNNSIIIEDDYDTELRYFGKPLPALKSLDKYNTVVYLGSFSSTLFPSFKVSYMVLPPALADVFASIKDQYTQACSKAEQLALAIFMEDGHYYTNIRRRRNLYSLKLDEALKAIKKHADGKIIPKDTKSGITLTIRVRSPKSAIELSALAKSMKLQIIPISEISDQDTSALSFYYSQLPFEKIDELIEKLVKIWEL